MTAGKPILYIASPDSELKIYAERYNNGKCFDDSELEEIASFIVQMSEDDALVQQYQRNSLDASLDFTRKNTGAILEAYS
jgi:hypothetical protein